MSPDRKIRHAQERLRYSILELVYLEAGDDCGHPVALNDIGEQLSIPTDQVLDAAEHLTFRCGFLALRHGRRFCITAAGLRYIQHEARRRRSVRG